MKKLDEQCRSTQTVYNRKTRVLPFGWTYEAQRVVGNDIYRSQLIVSDDMLKIDRRSAAHRLIRWRHEIRLACEAHK